MNWWPKHDDSPTDATVGTLELDAVEADLELRDGRTLLVWRWSADGRIVAVTEAAEA